MTTGSVGRSSRARKLVAPNSPRETAKAKPAAARRERQATGRSTVSRTRNGPAPREDAAWRWRSSMERNTGPTVRTTSGSATMAWAIGISSAELRRSTGGRSRVIRNPKPTVTAETPSGSMNNPSSTPVNRPPAGRETRNATSEPSDRARALATSALALSLGSLVAFLVSRPAGGRLTGVLDGLFMLPLGVSAVTVGFGFLITLDRPPLDLRSSALLIPIAQAMVALPLVVRTVGPVLRSIDDHQRQAAASLGAGPL